MQTILSPGRPLKTAALLFLLVANLPLLNAAETRSLDGEWRFAMDRDDIGIREGWHSRDLPDRIQLPGILQDQGYGDEIGADTPWVLSLYDRQWHQRQDYQAYTNAGSAKVPFVCQPKRHYVGVAWYQRDVRIPKNWNQKRVVLFLERTRWETTLWIDDRKVGSQNSLVAPHEYDLGNLSPGTHRLTLRVDNRMLMPYRPDAHAVSDSLGSTWNGVVGRIELQATTPVWLDDVQVNAGSPSPDDTNPSVQVKVRIGNSTGQPGSGTVRAAGRSVPVTWDATGGEAEFDVALKGQVERWDEFNPALQKLTVRLNGENARDRRTVTFGVRTFTTRDREFEINGRRTHLRGTHHGGDFPLTGYPPCDEDYWLDLFRTLKAWGLNHVRFHSFCPPEAAFTAADQLGMYLQPECGMWNVISPGTDIEKMMYAETDRMIRAYGNHPSFVLFSPSNEPKGHWKESLPKWIAHYREKDPRRLYTSGTGWSLIDDPEPVGDRVDYLAVHRVGPRLMRGTPGWFGADYASSYEGVDVPNIVHENGQWCAYPDYRVIEKFTGFIQPGNYEIFRDSLAAHGMADRDQDFAWASGRFQLACYKEEIEANLRTPGLGGFQLLDLHDYTGQGTALVGLLDPFWEEKSYVDAAEWRQFCSTTVPLARLRERLYTTQDALDVPVEVAHYGPAAWRRVTVTWRIEDAAGEITAAGEWLVDEIPLGKGTPLGTVATDLSRFEAPSMYRLVVELEPGGFDTPRPQDLHGLEKLTLAPIHNSWNFWVYPAPEPSTAPDDIVVTRSWNAAEAALAQGGDVLFLPPTADLDWSSPPLDRLPVFWNRLMSPGWSRMLGLWCDTNHPALAEFPTEANCDWQWTRLIRGVRAMNLDRLPAELKPIVQAIDDWNRSWKLGVVYEVKVGSGRLMVCTIDLENDLHRRPVASQLRRSLLDYMASPDFKPAVELSAEQFSRVLFDSRIMHRLNASAEAEGAKPEAAIDGDPNTYWLVGVPARGARPIPHPHALTIHFPTSVTMEGLVLMNRQNDRSHQGDIRTYRLESSEDGQQWSEIQTGQLASTWNPQTLLFQEPRTARHLRLTALSGYGDDPSAALAELAVLHAGPRVDTGQETIEYQRVRSTSTDVDEGN